jgi:tRNA pseudouridine55 synthase
MTLERDISSLSLAAASDERLLARDTFAQAERWHAALPTLGGVALIDKAKDWTSFDVVAKMRGITRIKKIGHAGSLDPLATGLLIVCLGKMTKSISSFQEQTKMYQAVVKLGATTKTDDAEAPEEQITSADEAIMGAITLTQVEKAAKEFLGVIAQIPPMYSAIKKNGVPMYKLARKGQEIEREARMVEFYRIDVERFEPPYCTLAVECSKGAYIRSLARDIGARLGVGGYLADLRRTGIGYYSVENAISIEEFSAIYA